MVAFHWAWGGVEGQLSNVPDTMAYRWLVAVLLAGDIRTEVDVSGSFRKVEGGRNSLRKGLKGMED